MATDTRDGGSRALQVELLPKGTVQFEQVLEQNVRGVITKELMGQWKQDKRDRRPKASLADSLAQGRAEAYGGKIKRMPTATADAAADACSFLLRGLVSTAAGTEAGMDCFSSTGAGAATGACFFAAGAAATEAVAATGAPFRAELLPALLAAGACG